MFKSVRSKPCALDTMERIYSPRRLEEHEA